ncbi:MFS transporter [Candidatus Daviesbacteria bacterium]|nr:MFS transporter [Candidatus Daviesbacteria bacterium]
MFFYHSLLHNRQFRYLESFYTHSLIRLFAVAIFQIFNGIYIYQTLLGFGLTFFQSIATSALIFSLMFLIQALSVAPSLWVIKRKGLRFSVFWGNIFLILFYVFLLLAQLDPIVFIVAAIFAGIQLGLYWTAYHIYFVELTDDDKQGKELSLNSSLGAIVSIGAPALGGLIISFFGYPAVFLVISFLMGLAIIPLKNLPKQDDKVPFDILETISLLSPKKEIKSLLAYSGMGISQITTQIFWPIFVLPIMAGVAGIGLLGSVIALFGSVSAISVGFLSDKFGAKKVLNILSPLDSIIGLSRLYVFNPLQVYGISMISSAMSEGQFITIDSLTYQRGRHTNIVAIIVQREVGLAVGRFLFLTLMGLLFWFGLPLGVVFVITALLALATRLYPEKI